MPAYFGLDIGSTSVKLAYSDGNNIKALGLAVNNLGKDVMVMTNQERLLMVDIIKNLVKESGIKQRQVVASIPEALVYSRVLKFPLMSTPELASAIKWELDQTVPFPPDEIEVSWVVLSKPERVMGNEKISVYVVAVPTKVSDLYIDLLELAGLEVIRLENEVPAIAKAFSSSLSDQSPSMIVNIGASGTRIVLSGKDILYGNYFMPVGGMALTKYVADNFNLPIAQAENYKRTYGMAKEQLEGKMYTALKPVVDGVIAEIRKMIVSYQNENKGGYVNKLILTGGGSYMNGLLAYFSENMTNMEVFVGDPFAGKSVSEKYKGYGPIYDIAYGLSL